MWFICLLGGGRENGRGGVGGFVSWLAGVAVPRSPGSRRRRLLVRRSGDRGRGRDVKRVPRPVHSSQGAAGAPSPAALPSPRPAPWDLAVSHLVLPSRVYISPYVCPCSSDVQVVSGEEMAEYEKCI